MTLEELISLYILQKDYHRASQAEKANHPFVLKHKELMQKYNIKVSTEMADNIFPGQPRIPFVILKPEIPAGEKRSVIVHTHGGPHVYFHEDTPHAEIMYLLSRGYIVVCPEYRGSNYFPAQLGTPDEKNIFNLHINSKDNLHVLAPEDVYAVAMHVQKYDFVDATKMSARGNSFGSHVNAYLLKGIKEGKFKSIFNGVHLCGGVRYPMAVDIPDNIPLFIGHSKVDTIAKFPVARQFMDHLLLRNMLNVEEGLPVAPIETFISEIGDHHMIVADLRVEDVGRDTYEDIASYLRRSMNFIDAINQRSEFSFTPVREQYKKIMGTRISVLAADEEIDRRIKAVRYIRTALPNSVTINRTAIESVVPTAALTPTLAHLKLVLGESYTGEPRKDFETYLLQYYKPEDYEKKLLIHTNVGKDMCDNVSFFNQCVEMIERERAVIQMNPDLMVMYHAGNATVLFIYTFTSIMKSILTGQPIDKLESLSELRLIEYIKTSLYDIELFLEKMRGKKSNKHKFNYIPGFPERAIAMNPALTFNPHDTSSTSLYWYFTQKSTGDVKFNNLFDTIFTLMGIDSVERRKKYIQFFKRECQELKARGEEQGVMQQIFIPYADAAASSYLCLIWGEEFGANNMNLANPKNMKEFCQNPASFEAKALQNRQAFVNHGKSHAFGVQTKGFSYSACMQGRHVPSNHSVQVHTYVRNPAHLEEFTQRLMKLIKADMADFIASTYEVSDALVPGCNAVKLAHQAKLGFFAAAHPFSKSELLMQQVELYRGLLIDPAVGWYRRIQQADKATKAEIQTYLFEKGLCFGYRKGNIYAVCLNVKGYTYMDLLLEAAEFQLAKNIEMYPNSEALFRNQHAELMHNIERFSSPTSIMQEYLGSNGFYNIRKSLEALESNPFDPERHEFTEFSAKMDETYDYTPSQTYHLDLSNAVESVVQHARFCKDACANRDKESKKTYLRKALQ